jgi:hypothetical protein
LVFKVLRLRDERDALLDETNLPGLQSRVDEAAAKARMAVYKAMEAIGDQWVN